MKWLSFQVCAWMVCWSAFGAADSQRPTHPIRLGGDLHPANLRCEYLRDPLGLDTPQPQLSWIAESSNSRARGLSQSAYQVLVASTRKQLDADQGDLWDTGKVGSAQTAQIAYAGKPLTSRQQCVWKVRIWDQDGKASEFSAPACWEMGLLSPGDWQARWIGRTSDIEERPAPMFRRQFKVDGKISRARVYVCGQGYYELRLNGRKVGDHLLDPGFTRFDKRGLYVTYDVAPYLNEGSNAVGVLLGHGWFNVQTRAVWDFHKAPWRAAPKLLLMMYLEYADGRAAVISSDGTWKCATGPIVFNSIYGGETYDARLEKAGWDLAGFDDSAWEPAKIVPAPKGVVSAQCMPPIRATQTLKPVKITEPSPGVFIYDFGQNFSGHVKLTASAPTGAKVVMKYGERLAEDGTLDRKDIEQHVVRTDASQSFQTDSYIFKGGERETWESRFVYHGFQYVEVTGFPGRPTLDNLLGVFTHTDVPEAGQFTCSNPMLNKIWRAARWSYLNNLQSIPTDCPHREKNGWTGDAHLAAEQGIFNYDAMTVYAKWIQDLADEQQPSGEMAAIVPTSGWGYKWGNGPAWDSAYLLIPLYLHQYYGDTRVLTRHYEGLRKYVDYLTTKATDGIVSIGLNDWAPYKTQTPADITSTAYYYRDAQIVSLTATLLGRTSEAKQYADLAASIKKAFNAKFYQPEKGLYGNGSQTALSCALYQGLVPLEDQKWVLDNLVAVIEGNNGHLDTGILGTKYLLNVLLEHGRADVAYQIVAQKDLPSWGWWLEQGATTLWEQWNGSESRNHIMFGDVSAWFFKALGGINPDPTFPGFQHIILKPHVLGDLTSAKAEYQSIRGRIASEWRVRQGEFNLTVTIPPNTTATLSLPVMDATKLRESGNRVAGLKGITFLREEPGRLVYEIQSGTYDFAGPLAGGEEK